MGGDVGSRCLPELQRFCLFERRLLPCHLARFDRIDVFFPELAAFKRALARFGKRHRDARAEPHVASATFALFGFRIAHQPASRRIAFGDPIAKDP